MGSTRRRGRIAAVLAAALLAGSALLFVESIGLILALTFWAVAALLFGNWYRTSTRPAVFETEATVAGAKADGFSVYWTNEGAKSHSAPAASQPANATN